MDETLRKEILLRSSKDFPWCAENLLKIRPKAGGLVPFKLNYAQRYVHECLEDQLRRTGKVRALIPKARQEGISTYIEGRFYHKVITNFGKKAFVLTHESEATSNLFEMVSRFHENLLPELKPSLVADNAREMSFNTDSGYKVGTAGNKQTGRGSTIQYFHASEVAFWPNDEDIAAGALQAVPDMDGTEVILESTGNGIGNLFYNMCQDAVKGIGEYEVIFVPWFWMEEYTTPELVKLTEDEKRYQIKYTLTDGQMAWRRKKIQQLGEVKFKQEYPAELIECFQTTDGESYIPAETVLDAQKNVIEKVDPYSPIVMGVDPARFGEDRTAIVYRAGRKMWHYETMQSMDTMEIAGLVLTRMREVEADAVFIDVVGLGAGVYDRLIELVGNDVVKSANAASKPLNRERYFNKRAEMWGEMKDWLEDEVDIPDDAEIMLDLTAPGYTYHSDGSLKLEKKEDMKKRGRKSPDIADALALTFAQPVKKLGPRYVEDGYVQRERSMLL